MVVAVGIDGYRRGWVAIVLVDGRYESALSAPDLAGLVAGLEAASCIGVDIPIGLPATGRRPADIEARRFVGPRRSSVFPTLPRAVWEASDLAAARSLNLAMSATSVSAQTYALRPRVLEADRVAHSDPRVREVHPEVSFRAMAGQPLTYAKSSWSGISLRRGFLLGVGIDLPDDLGAAGSAGIDDVLDAAAVAWSAHRIATGEAESFPAQPSEGPDGLVAAIWY